MPAAAGRARARGERLRAHLRAITETPAPTFEEGRRAELIARLWREAGLEPRVDPVGNVLADVPGGHGPRVVLAAHLDTVFPADTDVRVREEASDRWAAPGVGDNSASLAVLVALAEELAGERAEGPAGEPGGPAVARPRLMLAATVGEEGLGDLRGAQALVAEVRHACDAFVAVDGHLGTIVHQAVGSRRFEAVVSGPGGHSWGDYGLPSAIHAVGDALHAVTRVRVPSEPRSSLNVGLVSGGSAVNAIAAEARFTVDVRSVDQTVLDTLDGDARRRVRTVVRRHGCDVELRTVGDRPAATGGNEALVAAARTALAGAGVEARVSASSTDANAAMAAGIPAICFGVYRGGDAHRLGEWCDPGTLERGLEALWGLLAELARG